MSNIGQAADSPCVTFFPVIPTEQQDFLNMAEMHFRGLDPNFQPHDDWKSCYLDNILKNPRLFLRWISSGNARVGFILFGLEDHRFLPRQTGMIYELYVSPIFRRKGIARHSAQLAIAELQLHSPSKVQLEVVKGNNAALKLWQSLGFERVSERLVLRRRPG